MPKTAEVKWREIQDAALDHDLFKDIRDRQVETVAFSPEAVLRC